MTFENLFNFRDLGGPQTEDGGRVQSGRLYRSESVAYLSAADAARLVDEIGIATVVDLRGDREVGRWGRGLLGERSLRYVHVPITDVTRGFGSMSTYYVDMLTRRADDVVGLLRGLLEPGALPAVVHCEMGCDRTGVVAATVLGLVGVPDEAIITDFDLTQPALPAMNARWKAGYLARGNPPEKWADETWAEREEAMADAIAAMRGRWGGWAGWAAAHGFTEDEREQLRKLLVEQPR
jgi:protein tyrosine/serine phosphatase